VADLHAAAEQISTHAEAADAGIEDEALFEFVGGSEFHPALDVIALSYGIMIGARAAFDKRGDDNG
jgi:hypothetical protein